MVTFTKFGSCVTSDVFNFMNISNYYPKHIYTGINIATAVHKADIPILEEDLVAENGFWEKMQKYCFSHEALDDCIKKGNRIILYLICVMKDFLYKNGSVEDLRQIFR